MSAAPLLIGPLGPFEPDEDTRIVTRADGRWLVSERAPSCALRLSDANPSGKVQVWAAPSSPLAAALGVEVGRAELFADGLLVAALAPGEWLALTPEVGAVLEAALRELPGGPAAVLVERSAGLALFRLTGRDAPAALASVCPDVAAATPDDGAVLSAPLDGIRSTIIRDDLLPEELAAEHAGGPADEPLVCSFLLVCDRSQARSLHTRLLEAGRPYGIAAEGFARYRSYHHDV